MPLDFPESDWKIFRRLHPLVVERYFARVMAEIAQIVADEARPQAERFWNLDDLVHKRKKEIGWLIEDFRRSTAQRQIAAFDADGLPGDDEIAQFSQSTRDYVELTRKFNAQRKGE